jgi:hypothetical protein
MECDAIMSGGDTTITTRIPISIDVSACRLAPRSQQSAVNRTGSAKRQKWSSPHGDHITKCSDVARDTSLMEAGMTFMENLEPLLNAAAKYAELSELSDKNPTPHTIMLQSDAAKELLKAAIEYAKWRD